MDRLPFFQLFLVVAGLSQHCFAAPSLVDTQGRPIDASFYRRDYTVVLLVDRNNIDHVSEEIDRVKKKFAASTIANSKEKPMEDFQFLLIWDGREDFRRQFDAKASKFNRPRGFHPRKKIVRGAIRPIAERIAHKQLAEGDSEMDQVVLETVNEQLGPYISAGKYRAVALFNSPNDRRVLRGNGQLRLQFKSTGPSAQKMVELFGSSTPLLRAAILDHDGNITHHWEGNHTDPLAVLDAYFKLKEPELRARIAALEAKEAARHPAGEHYKDPAVFGRIQQTAVQENRPSMVPVLEVFEDYTEAIGICRARDGYLAAEMFRDYLFDVFHEVETQIGFLKDANAATQWWYREEFRTYVENATLLGRLYLRNYAKRFQKVELGEAEKALDKAAYDIYREVSEMTSLEVVSEKEMEARLSTLDPAAFKDNPKFKRALKALDLLKTEAVDCTERFDLGSESIPTPHAPTTRNH